MIPEFGDDGTLPPGIHWAEWAEIERRLICNPLRRRLLGGFKDGIELLRAAGCKRVYLDGSFVTAKEFPQDFDACWDTDGVDPTYLDPVFLDFSRGRAAQKARFRGEFFPAQFAEAGSGRTFLDFFQTNRETGAKKGIVAVDLERLPL